MNEEDDECGYGQKERVDADDVESELEGASMHGEDAAVEKEDGDFDEAEARPLKKTDYIGRLYDGYLSIA